MTTAYCTILAANYLPRAVALADSVRRHHDGTELAILFIDAAEDTALPDVPGARCLSTASLGLSPRRVLELAAAYDLVELATAVKPLLLQALLRHADRAVYLDPDTFVCSPMVELAPALDASPGGILLTPHFLGPAPVGADITEGHMLLVGVYNLGFCAVDRRAADFLDWWWGHLRAECLYDPLSGVFYDQKWLDIGSVLFGAGVLRHPGYNVGIGNLSERPVGEDAEGYTVASTGDRLRLFHFHAFDPLAPETLSVRFRHSIDHPLQDDSVLLQLCKEYASVLLAAEHRLPAPPPYPYATDTGGRAIGRQLRRAYRMALHGDGATPPSPFVATEAAEWERWRRRAVAHRGRWLADDAAKALRILLPAEYERLRRRFPDLADALRRRFAGGSGLWGRG